MKMIEISDSKKDKLADYTEKILHIAGKMMQCVENLDGDSDYGERSYRHMGSRMPDDDYEPEMDYGSRRGVRGTGPYSRYRY